MTFKVGDKVSYVGTRDKFRGLKGEILSRERHGYMVTWSNSSPHYMDEINLCLETPFIEKAKQVQITLKSMVDILKDNDCWFDTYGNLTSVHGHLAPSYFKDLGKTKEVNEGCSFALPDTDWLKVLPKKYEKWI